MLRFHLIKQITEKKGITFIMAMFLFIILSLITFGLVQLVRYESRQSAYGNLSEKALYIAEAGIERKIAELKEDNTSSISLTKYGEGEFEVSVVAGPGSDEYTLESTGYVPSKSKWKARRKLRVVVRVLPSVPSHALAFGGDAVIESNVTIRGTIRSNRKIVIGSNVTITESEPGKGDASIYTSYDKDDPAISIGTNFHVAVPGQYIKSRRNSSLSPNQHPPYSGSDPTPQIYDETNIVEKTNVTIVENDNSSDTDPIQVPSVDTATLVANADYTVTPSNYTSIPGFTPAWSWDSKDNVFELNASNWDPGGKIYNFTEGIKIVSNVTFTGEGTFIVSDGEADYGIELRQNVDGVYDGYARLNLLVVGGDWDEYDIWMRQNIYIQGYIFGKSTSTVESNVNIKGIVEIGDESTINSNITIEHSDDIPMDLPWQQGSTGGIEIISWQEIKPD
ncbi:MAG: hypothetical protein DRI36_03140 [Caldiserica bacterium]|nr:MAG: hypothetical protein DRI36_03140 [Caldisericota bacterium]